MIVRIMCALTAFARRADDARTHCVLKRVRTPADRRAQ
jgi:hypothetical protein